MSNRVIQTTQTRAGMRSLFAADQAGLKAVFSHIAVGSSGYLPTGEETALQSEFARVEINASEYLSDYELLITGTLEGDTEGWVNEMGLYLEDGTLFALWSEVNAPLAYKSRDLSLTPAFTLALHSLPKNAIEVKVAPSNVTIQIGSNGRLPFMAVDGVTLGVPDAPRNDAAWLVGVGATGLFLGKDNMIAERQGMAWVFKDAPPRTLITLPDGSFREKQHNGTWILWHMPQDMPIRVVWLDALSGSDSHSGETVNTPVKTLRKALTLASAGQHLRVNLLADLALNESITTHLSSLSFASHDVSGAYGAALGIRRKISFVNDDAALWFKGFCAMRCEGVDFDIPHKSHAGVAFYFTFGGKVQLWNSTIRAALNANTPLFSTHHHASFSCRLLTLMPDTVKPLVFSGGWMDDIKASTSTTNSSSTATGSTTYDMNNVVGGKITKLEEDVIYDIIAYGNLDYIAVGNATGTGLPQSLVRLFIGQLPCRIMQMASGVFSCRVFKPSVGSPVYGSSAHLVTMVNMSNTESTSYNAAMAPDMLIAPGGFPSGQYSLGLTSVDPPTVPGHFYGFAKVVSVKVV
jgi:hypothetical protein